MRLVVGLSDTLDKPDLGAGLEMRRGLGAGLGLLGRPVSDKLGPEAGWAGLTGLASRRVAGWAGPEPSLRHVRQAWQAGGHAFHKKAIFQ